MSKKILILFFITLGLALLVLLVPRPTSFQSSSKPFYPDVKADALTAIGLEYFIQGVHLEKDTSGNWTIQNKKTSLRDTVDQKDETNNLKDEKEDFAKYPADSSKVAHLLDKITGLEKGAVISSNPEKQGAFELTKVARSVTLYGKDGKKLAKLLIGKPGPDFLSAYVREENSDDVYLVPEPLQQLITPDLDTWKKKEVKKEESK